MIAVIDYGAGNLRSIRRALEASGADVVVTSDPQVVTEAQAVVLPGVGAAGAAMSRLAEMGMDRAVEIAARDRKPFLGICLGMQLLFEEQEEGDTRGLGLLRGRVRALPPTVKIPHMGWNRSRIVADGPLGAAGDERDYYFVHSYIVEQCERDDVAAEVVYGETFPSVVVRDNIWGTQFHPEKSGMVGLRFINAFVAQTAGNAISNPAAPAP